MNVFYTSHCPIEAAENLAYRHVTKMIVEGCQVLSTAHHILGTSLEVSSIYKSTHKNHPSAVWARASRDHYDWLWMHTKRLCEIYTSVRGRVHASESVLDLLLSYPTAIPSKGFVEPPKCVDDEFKNMSDVCEAYQLYLKKKYQEWVDRDKPLVVEFPVNVPTYMQ